MHVCGLVSTRMCTEPLCVSVCLPAAARSQFSAVPFFSLPSSTTLGLYIGGSTRVGLMSEIRMSLGEPPIESCGKSDGQVRIRQLRVRQPSGLCLVMSSLSIPHIRLTQPLIVTLITVKITRQKNTVYSLNKHKFDCAVFIKYDELHL